MSFIMSPIEYTLNEDNSYDAFANLQVGSNGETNGTPTSFIGDADGDENWAYQAWESSSAASFDTSNVSVSFEVMSDGNETLNVGNSSSLTYETGGIGPISSVTLEAAVQVNATASWSNVNVEFLRNGAIVETDSFNTGPQVSTVNSGHSNVEDQTLTVTPSAPNDDEALITGVMRMTAPGINLPAPQAMFCNIFVNGADSSSSGTGGGITISGNGNGG
jgi:hypothetical protein